MPPWGYGKDPRCILPVGDQRSYYNEDQKNVHVWQSAAPRLVSGSDGPVGGPGTVCLLAAAFCPPLTGPAGRPIVTKRLFYSWTRYICYPPLANHPSVDQVNFWDYDRLEGVHANRDYRLLLLEEDPRVTDLPLANEYSTLPQVPYDQTAMEAGHYLLVRVKYRDGAPKFFPCELNLQLPAIDERNESFNGTANESGRATPNRKASVRKKVRLRDLRCRVTGAVAPARQKGLNFTGLQVAHIFPLAAASLFHLAFDPQAHSKTVYEPLGIPAINAAPPSSRLDQVKNAIVIRADAHAQFDIYEFSLEYVTFQNRSAYLLRRFERDGAPSIRDEAQARFLHDALGDPASRCDDIDPILVNHHYLTGVLWHVAGNGRPGVDESVNVITDGYIDGHASLK
ncbi:hypothetical protein C8R43DRAFT_73674 [Mycena crocata]|nr:hypothetical protein C8R43DRAFT_73674 [Mycena crocata]